MPNIKNIFSIVIFIVAFLFGNSANALTISPLKNIITVAPGGQARVLVTALNEEMKEIVVESQIQGVQQDKNGKTVLTLNSDVAESWVVIEKEKKTLKSGESTVLEFAINVPSNAVPGTHYLGLGVKQFSLGKSGIAGEISSLLLLQVAGEAHESLLIENFYGHQSQLYKNEWPYFLQIKNNGNIELPLGGNVDILDAKGVKKFSAELVLGNKLLPQTERVADRILSFDSKKINLPGKYFVKMNIRYGFTNQMVSVVRSFWYFPVWSMVAAGLVVLILVILLVLAVKLKRK